jgi:hypothetical protein
MGIHFNMGQNSSQFNHLLLRIGSIAFVAGVIIAIISTAIHPSKEDPSNHPLVFAEYASNDSWIAVHIGQFVGVFYLGGNSRWFYVEKINVTKILKSPLNKGK